MLVTYKLPQSIELGTSNLDTNPPQLRTQNSQNDESLC
jgi:hypothetical protein